MSTKTSSANSNYFQNFWNNFSFNQCAQGINNFNDAFQCAANGFQNSFTQGTKYVTKTMQNSADYASQVNLGGDFESNSKAFNNYLSQVYNETSANSQVQVQQAFKTLNDLTNAFLNNSGK